MFFKQYFRLLYEGIVLLLCNEFSPEGIKIVSQLILVI